MDMTDEKTVGKIGELYGVEAMIIGTISKFGSTSTIIGRIINTETGIVPKTSEVESSGLEAVRREVVLLANVLCDITREELQIIEDDELRPCVQLAISGVYRFAVQ